ncbi:unnamed protein product [Chrysodeixis includens]|uniref:Uncharacterized protein n=1 Tax=Chrysodeixis includens TaxID=689277 RepID=A0A9N8PWK0_CHRIL|nr:unnamed protein product [Chrysodeixis includens]
MFSTESRVAVTRHEPTSVSPWRGGGVLEQARVRAPGAPRAPGPAPRALAPAPPARVSTPAAERRSGRRGPRLPRARHAAPLHARTAAPPHHRTASRNPRHTTS